MLQVGVIGYGYWGPNIVRNFNRSEGAKVVAVCDKQQQIAGNITKSFPDIRVYTDAHDITKAHDIDIVAIVTPVSTHFELAKDALENGKHIFVEKPFTASIEEAEQLIALAERKRCKIMVDHTFLFTGAVRKIKDIMDRDELGKIYYYDSTRVNLGLFQHDVNVIWDLAPHDFSIMQYVVNEEPAALTACGRNHICKYENIAFVTVFFESNLIAHFNVNWLSPVKIRNTLIGGEKKMLVWDDINADEKIRIYDKGIEVYTKEEINELLVSYRTGDMWVPKIDQTEALKLESEYFITCITQDTTPINDGYAGLQVVKMLVACNESLGNNGKMVSV